LWCPSSNSTSSSKPRCTPPTPCWGALGSLATPLRSSHCPRDRGGTQDGDGSGCRAVRGRAIGRSRGVLPGNPSDGVFAQRRGRQRCGLMCNPHGRCWLPSTLLRACFDIPDMSMFLCFRGPSGSDALSTIPCKSAQRICTEGTLQRVTGICKTPAETCFTTSAEEPGGQDGVWPVRAFFASLDLIRVKRLEPGASQ
jgi:hypothetical protein